MVFDIRSRFKSISWKSKFQAFTMHFGISLLIFIVLLYFILFQWYPHPFFSTDGGTQGLRLIIFVDLVLGPALTFIVFKRGKPSLRYDLTVIAMLQVGALMWGMWAVHNERPVALVFAEDRFHPIPYYQFIEAGNKLNDLKKFGDTLPVKIFVELPGEQDSEARLKLFKEAYQTRTPLFLMGDRYRRMDETYRGALTRHSIDLNTYLKSDYLGDKKALMQHRYTQFLAGLHAPPEDYLFLALYARYCKCILVAERDSLEVVDVLDIPPPQITQNVIKVNKDMTASQTP